jgi:hypothetical protein
MRALRAAGLLLVVLLFWIPARAANLKLYLKDGSYQVVREYQVLEDRVRFYSVERGEWEEIPLDLIDLKRTETEVKERQAAIAEEAKVFTADEQARREQQREIDRVPQNTGVYLLEGKELKPLKQAECETVTNKGRSILKVLVPLPVVAKETTVELNGTRSEQVVTNPQPEFYFRLAADEPHMIVRLGLKRDSRLVQKWAIMPMSEEVVEEQEEIPAFRRQLDEGLVKIWPKEPLKPGEYAVVEYSPGQRNIQVWDFSLR